MGWNFNFSLVLLAFQHSKKPSVWNFCFVTSCVTWLYSSSTKWRKGNSPKYNLNSGWWNITIHPATCHLCLICVSRELRVRFFVWKTLGWSDVIDGPLGWAKRWAKPRSANFKLLGGIGSPLLSGEFQVKKGSLSGVKLRGWCHNHPASIASSQNKLP